MKENKPPSFWTEYKKIVKAHFLPGNWDIKLLSVMFWISFGTFLLLHSYGY
jgi:hypothetical protein